MSSAKWRHFYVYRNVFNYLYIDRICWSLMDVVLKVVCPYLTILRLPDENRRVTEVTPFSTQAGSAMIGTINALLSLCITSSAATRTRSITLQWRQNGRDSVSNHQPHDCLLNCLFRRRSKKISKLRVTGLCVVNSPGTGEFPAQRASNAENVSIWWRHHD